MDEHTGDLFLKIICAFGKESKSALAKLGDDKITK